MPRITTGGAFGITRQQTLMCELTAKGWSTREIAIALFDCRNESGAQADEAKVQKAMGKIRQWRQNPKVQACYTALIKEVALPGVAKATKRLTEQIDSPNEWIANKASNDVLNRFGQELFGEDDKSVTIRIEGAPLIGIPDGD